MAISIKDELGSLSKEAQDRLKYALQSEISWVEVGKNNRFVAVHVNSSNPTVNIEAMAGEWSCGTMKKPTKEGSH